MSDFKIGKVIHFYDKLGVIIVELDSALGVGDRIKFVRGGEEMFEQMVDSIQVGHKKVSNASKGDVVGLKVDREVKEGAEIYKEEIT